jgi:hypothetical protein
MRRDAAGAAAGAGNGASLSAGGARCAAGRYRAAIDAIVRVEVRPYRQEWLDDVGIGAHLRRGLDGHQVLARNWGR